MAQRLPNASFVTRAGVQMQRIVRRLSTSNPEAGTPTTMCDSNDNDFVVIYAIQHEIRESMNRALSQISAHDSGRERQLQNSVLRILKLG